MYYFKYIRWWLALWLLSIVTVAIANPSTLNVKGPFHQIVVSGDMKVNLHSTSGSSYAIAKGDVTDLANIDCVISNGWLKVNVGKGYPKVDSISVDIWVHNLRTLVQRGSAQVTGHLLHSNGLTVSSLGTTFLKLDGNLGLTGLQVGGASHVEISGIETKNLNLDLRGKACVRLAGKIGISQMHVCDQSWLSLYWLNMDRLELTYGDHAFVQMAGQALVLDLEMYGNAKFAGRYLRANRAFVKTHDHAIAQISGVRSQHTLALDSSKIDFFNVPTMKTDFAAEHGEMLDLREWTMPR